MAAKKGVAAPEFVDIPIGLIEEPIGRIRMEISQDAIEELAQSIREEGLFYPVMVRKSGKRYEIIDGHRRYLAIRFLGDKVVPCKIASMDDLKVAIGRAAANIQREDISPIEEGSVYADLQERFGLSPELISKRMGKKVSRVKRRMDMLKMPVILQRAIHERKIAASTGEELWRLGDEASIEYYLTFAIENGATKEVVRGWVNDHQKRLRTSGDAGSGGSPLQSPNAPQKYFVACDICQDPVELGKDINLRACEACMNAIRQALSKQG